eukprot:CAMPEP_0197032380 /NCGR_PEP_ID=MMETSP1384-20130603/11070_1 /TAXON_ID=29189 /ORGANISM="Ammonia sp." /LENGTH=423 /DNA_ID=CAMNT_0042462029 /DNA_START=36 /DNA_END=1304 /DNA_ORIENTATION=+
MKKGVELSPNKARLLYSRLSPQDEYEERQHIENIKALTDIDDEYESTGANKVYREVILITISLFMGYASLVCLQKKLYNQWQDNVGGTLSNQQQELFEHGTSLIYFGNLLFRLLHNVIFAAFTPRIRVVISLCCMCVSMLTLVIFYWWIRSEFVLWVYLSYLFGGIGIGSFESNILSTITPLGNETKLWAMMGIPVGFLTITVGGYAFMAILDSNTSVVYIYLTVFACCSMSVFLWLLRIPIPSSYDHQQSFREFMDHLLLWRQWLPHIKVYCIALLFDMFCLSFNTAINQYIYDGDTFPLFGWIYPYKIMMDQNVFFCVLNLCQFIGDSSGRKIIYYFKLTVQPFWFLILSFVGIALCMTKVPVFALIATLLVTFGNGSIYSSSTYFIDSHLTRENRQFLLTSLSVWLFIGDMGSITGSNVW